MNRPRFICRLFKDGKEVAPPEVLCASEKPPWTISTWMESKTKVHTENIGGTMRMCFYRQNIEDFDEVWLGYFNPDFKLMEEW